LAARFEESFGATTTLIQGSGGIFDVTVDDKLVYSKHQTGDFPDEDRLLGEISAG